jgi:mannose-1-phosphate guanylyltransferase/mannose-6-phosphate isomerase
MPDKIIPLILCGGAGTRLWPLSRETFPKQFVSLLGARSTFQETVLRVSDSRLFEKPIVITGAAHRFIIKEQLAELGVEADILLESARRDSGPAIAAGAIFARKRHSAAVVLALAADHVVKDVAGFAMACKSSLGVASAGQIVTFGVKPERPATEYGYIRPGSVIEGEVRRVDAFVEKPDHDTAVRYVAEGYLWNSGNFMFLADVLLDEYRAVDAASIETVEQAIDRGVRELGFVSLDKEAFERAKPISIDYAVMEKTRRAAVVPVSFDWSDVGSWHAVWELSDKDIDGNAARGLAVFENAKDCNVWSDKALVALEGVEDLVVISTSDAILVSRKNSAAGLKRVVARLKANGSQATEGHTRVHQPWGTHESLNVGEHHQVTRVVLKAGETSVLDGRCEHSEHWVVVQGTAVFVIDGQSRIVRANESIRIPSGAVRCLGSQEKAPVEMIRIDVATDAFIAR